MKLLKTATLASLLSILLLFSPSTIPAAGPLSLFGNKVDADPNKEYVLKETDGPWMILVASFSGPTARQDANILTLELRKRYKYNAFVFDQTFIHDLKQEDKPRNPYDRGRNFQKKGTVHEYAVLIGNFQSIDDKDFQKTLRGVKECFPDCIKGGPNSVVISPNFAAIRQRTARDENGRVRGPFYMAFGCVNPMLPQDYLSQRNVDEFIEKINSDSPNSLLNCSARYTVQIATFTGKTEIQQDRIKNILDGKQDFTPKKKQSDLEIGGKAAARLAAALRAMGYDAYEFHDRYASIVTVGGFDEIGYELPNGMTELRPEIVDIMNRFRAKPADPSRVQTGAVKTISYQPVVIIDIECDSQPQIIEVPKRRHSGLVLK